VGLLAIPVVCLVIVIRSQGRDASWDVRSVTEAENFYMHEVGPVLDLGPGTLNKATRAQLADQIDARIAKLNQLSERIPGGEGQELQELSRLFELAKNCVNKGRNCSEEDRDAILQQEKRAGFIRQRAP
jgi:hypothetical protein